MSFLAGANEFLAGVRPYADAGICAFALVLVARHVVLTSLGFVRFLDRLERKDPAPLPTVSIVVPAYNEGTVVETVVRSLVALDYPHFEVIVVDDGSTDDTLAQLKALAAHGDHPPGRLRILAKHNGGKASALNLGISAATSELVLCVDADATLTPDALRKATPYFIDPKVGAVAGNVKVVNRNSMLTRFQALEYIQGITIVRRAQSCFGAVNIVPGPFGLFRRRILLQVGGFDTDTFAEDCDLTLKVLAAGWKIHYEPSAIAYTEAPEGVRDLIQQRYRWTRGTLQAIRKHSRYLFSARHGSTSLGLWWLCFEGFLWPLANVAAVLYTIAVVASGATTLPIVVWWCLFGLLDIATAAYCIAIDDEEWGLIPHALMYRIVCFGPAMDCWRLFSWFDELLSIEMSWGQVMRRGYVRDEN